MKKLTRVEITDAPVGKILCDMHDGDRQFPADLAMERVKIPYMWALELIKKATHSSPDNPYTPGTINKYLYVIWQEYIEGDVNIICAYVYDGTGYLVCFKGDWDSYETEERADMEARVAHIDSGEGFAQYKREEALMSAQAEEDEDDLRS